MQNTELFKNYTVSFSSNLWFILLGNFAHLKGLEKYFFLKKSKLQFSCNYLVENPRCKKKY